MFARAFESYIDTKLKNQGISCQFLVSLEKSPLWPNEYEQNDSSHLFDSLFDWIRENSSKLNPNFSEVRND